LGPVYHIEKDNWRILTNKEIYAMVKIHTITETVMLNRLLWFGHVQRMEENRIESGLAPTNATSPPNYAGHRQRKKPTSANNAHLAKTLLCHNST